MNVLWILIACAALALLVLGILVVAAATASRSKRSPPAATPTKETENPYRKLYYSNVKK